MAACKVLQSLTSVRLTCSGKRLFSPVSNQTYTKAFLSGVLGCRQVCCSSGCRSNNILNDGSVKTPKKKTAPIPKITLLYPDNTMTVTTLKEAQKLAKRRNYTLIQEAEVDAASRRATYKLYPISYVKCENEGVSKESSNDDHSKRPKVFILESKITSHDLDVKMSKMINLLEKKHEIKITIAHSHKSGDHIVEEIKRAMKDNGIIKEISVGHERTRITIVPQLKNNNEPKVGEEKDESAEKKSN